MTFFHTLESPIGPILVTSNGVGLTRMFTNLHRSGNPIQPDWVQDASPFDQVAKELREYFAGERREFTVPLAPQGTAFQQSVWEQLRLIPFGETRSYLDIARAIGNEKATRAVGLANGANPISIIVPCHRVIGSNRKLTGYAGGLETKQWLLTHEGSLPQGDLFGNR